MNELLIKMYREMLLIRRFDEKLIQLYFERKIGGFVHTSLGHEAIAVGVVNAMQPIDQIVSYYRGHGHCLAKGLAPQKMMAEIMGEKTGYCQGKSGSIQMMDFESGVIAATGIVAEGIPIAVGAALANKAKNNGKVVVVFFGDGATNNGMFYESLNCSALLKLPIVFICENNGISTSVRSEQTTANTRIEKKVAAMGVQSAGVDGTDAEHVFKKAKEFIESARQDSRPYFLNCKTVRLYGHTVADQMGLKFRSLEESKLIRRKCPLLKMKRKLLKRQIIDPFVLTQIDKQEIRAEIDKALQFKKQSRRLESLIYA